MNNTQKLWEFFSFLVNKIKTETHVSYLCRVTAIADNQTCTVQPLDYNGNAKRPLILSVRIPRHVRDDIRVGSAVAVSFFDRDVSEASVGTTRDIENASKRMHSLNDAYVTGVF